MATSTNNAPKRKLLFKTELCSSWLRRGRCEYGDKCSFAHGADELRRRTEVPRCKNYKSLPCQGWIACGVCPYGTNCQFSHDPRLAADEEDAHTGKIRALKKRREDLKDIYFWPNNTKKASDVYEPGNSNATVTALWKTLVDTLLREKRQQQQTPPPPPHTKRLPIFTQLVAG